MNTKCQSHQLDDFSDRASRVLQRQFYMKEVRMTLQLLQISLNSFSNFVRSAPSLIVNLKQMQRSGSIPVEGGIKAADQLPYLYSNSMWNVGLKGSQESYSKYPSSKSISIFQLFIMLPQLSRRYISLALQSRYFSGDHHAPPKPRTDLLSKEDIQKYEKFIPVEPDYTEGLFSPGNVLPKIRPLNSSWFVKFLAKSFSSYEVESVSDTYHPPKLTENSVFIYQSNQLGTFQRQLRSGDYLLFGFLFGVAEYPVFSATVFGIFYLMMLNSMAYNLQRRLVLRADLLPHIDAVNFQKVGPFGKILNYEVNVEDLEHVNFEQFKEKENYFWGLNYKYLDQRMIFRCRSTQELFLFDRTGLWSREGLNHKLLN